MNATTTQLIDEIERVAARNARYEADLQKSQVERCLNLTLSAGKAIARQFGIDVIPTINTNTVRTVEGLPFGRTVISQNHRGDIFSTGFFHANGKKCVVHATYNTYTRMSDVRVEVITAKRFSSTRREVFTAAGLLGELNR